jgi:hypothetical protein
MITTKEDFESVYEGGREDERDLILRMLEKHVDHVPGEMNDGCDVCWRGPGIRMAIMMIKGEV